MSKYSVYSEFNIRDHQRTFVDYLEVVIDKTGHIMYAVPSHQEKMVSIVCMKKGISRDELISLCPRDRYCDYLDWLCEVSECISAWNDFFAGRLISREQEDALISLKDSGLYSGSVRKSLYQPETQTKKQ